MQTVPFGDLAEALREMAVFDRMLLQFAGVAELRGRGFGATPREVKAWRDRIERVENTARMLTILIPHEHVVRGLDPDLAVVPAPAPESLIRDR